MANSYRVTSGKNFKLSSHDPDDTDALGGEEEARGRLMLDATAIDKLQDSLYGEGRRALLVILQGMDTSGKDGTIRGVSTPPARWA